MIKRILNGINSRIYFVLSRLISKIHLKWNDVKIGKNVHIYGILNVSNLKGKIEIGNNSVLNSSWYINKAGGGQVRCSLVTEEYGKIIIGENVGISNSTIYSRSLIQIEDDVMIGVNNIIYDTDHHSVEYVDRINGNRNIKSSPVLIKKGAWIGGHCIILKGVTIGKYAVIGAGSVVTHDVPDLEVWAGNPAKFVKKLKNKETNLRNACNLS